jgi:hypothetical protein
MTSVTIDSNILREAAAVTLALGSSFTLNILYQVYCKVKSLKAHLQKKKEGSKERYNRFTDPMMLPGDRSVGNFVEWQTTFLSLYWCNALLTGKDMWIGWIYVAIRTAYPYLAHIGGIKESGARSRIFLATVPGYMVLIRLFYNIFMELAFR